MKLHTPLYSVIIPVYNRPGELTDLLESLVKQSFSDFEVVVVDDGSHQKSDEVVDRYREQLSIQYIYKPNSGPGPSRNMGFQYARGNFFVVFDSDCIIPPHYMETVDQALKQKKCDAWGGPDRGHEDFNAVQRATAYTMSSFFTTGGIRGGKKRLGQFQPRSFNMGLSRKVFEETGGFLFDRFAEDIELSIRMQKKGFRICLIKDAFVYHKRRVNLKQFYRQVFNFGKGRVLVGRAHPGAVKLIHWIPAMFIFWILFGFCVVVIKPWFGLGLLGCVLFYLLILGMDAGRVTRSFSVGLVAIPAALFQFWGYGMGFLREKLKFQQKN